MPLKELTQSTLLLTFPMSIAMIFVEELTVDSLIVRLAYAPTVLLSQELLLPFRVLSRTERKGKSIEYL